MSASAARGRAIAVAAMVVGLFVTTAVIGYFHFGAVLAAIRPIGAWGFLAVIAAQLLLFVPLGAAWRLAAPPQGGRTGVFIWGRLIREAASDVLPFSQLGGLVIAARAAVLGGVSVAAAFGSTVVDITFEIVAQMIYTLVGIGLLANRLGFAAHDNRLLVSLWAGLAVAAGVIMAFILAQHRGLGAVERLVRKMLPAAADHAAAVSAVVVGAYRRPLRLGLCLGLHVAAWFGGAVGTWLILRFIERPLPFLSVVAIESLLFAIRNAAFVAPSGLGVQEAAYVLLGPLFGLPPDAALALSLLKRSRDIVIGVPALLSWQYFESRRVRRAAGRAAA